MAGSTEAASRVNFNPDWMGNSSKQKCPSFTSSSHQQDKTSANDTILAPPKLSKNRYGREELLALFSSDVAAPSRLKDDFTDFFIASPQKPICMQQLSDVEQQLTMHGGVNSSKVLNVVNHAERFHGPGQRWANLPTGPSRGVGRGASDSQSSQQPFYGQGARGRGSAFVSGGEQRFGGGGFGRGRLDSRGNPGAGRGVGGMMTEAKDPVLQRNTRAQGLYGSSGAAGKDRPRQRIKSTSKSDESDDLNHNPSVQDHSKTKYSTSSPSSAPQQQLPEWAKDDDDVGASSPGGTFDATGSFRRLDQLKTGQQRDDAVLPPPSKYVDDAVAVPSTTKRRTPQTFAAAAGGDGKTTTPAASAATSSGADARSKVPAVAQKRHDGSVTSTPQTMTSLAAQAAMTSSPPGPLTPATTVSTATAPLSVKTTAIDATRHFLVTPNDGGVKKLTATTAPPSSKKPGVGGKKTAEDDVLSSLHQQAESLVKAVCLDDTGPAISKSVSSILSVAAASAPASVGKSPISSKSDSWYYIDPSDKCQGPFSAEMMAAWFSAGYFTMDLKVGQSKEDNFMSLGDVIKSLGAIPFLTPSGGSSTASSNLQSNLVNAQNASPLYNALNLNQRPAAPQNPLPANQSGASLVGSAPNALNCSVVSPAPAAAFYGYQSSGGGAVATAAAATAPTTAATNQSAPFSPADALAFLISHPSTLGSTTIGQANMSSNLIGRPSLNPPAVANGSNVGLNLHTLPSSPYGTATVAPTTMYHMSSGAAATQPPSASMLNITGAPPYNAASSVPSNAPSGHQSNGRASTIWDVYNNASTNSLDSIANNKSTVTQQQPNVSSTQEVEQRLKLMIEQLKQRDEARIKELTKQEEERQRLEEEKHRLIEMRTKMEKEAQEKERLLRETEEKLKAQLDAKKREKAWIEEVKRCEKADLSSAVQAKKGAQQNEQRVNEAKVKEEANRRKQAQEQQQKQAAAKLLEDKQRKQKEAEEHQRKLAEEMRRKEEEEARIRQLREQNEKENRELRRMEEERRRQLLSKQQEQLKSNVASTSAWAKAPETKPAEVTVPPGQSLREIQLEEERQMAAERRQMLEMELTKKFTPSPDVQSTGAAAWNSGGAGAWGAKTPLASKALNWNGPPAATVTSSSSSSSKNAWSSSTTATQRFLNSTSNSDATTTGDGTDGFWDDDTPSSKDPKSLVFMNSSHTKSQVPAKAKPTQTKGAKSTVNKPQPAHQNSALKRYLTTATQPVDEFSVWCIKQVKKLNKEIDESEAAVFIEFLKHVPDLEVTDYVLGYVPDTQASKEFLKEYLERRAFANKTSKSGAPNEWSVVNKQHGERESSSVHQQAKRRQKKNAGQQANTSILGFVAAGDPNRLNVGEIDSPM